MLDYSSHAMSWEFVGLAYSLMDWGRKMEMGVPNVNRDTWEGGTGGIMKEEEERRDSKQTQKKGGIATDTKVSMVHAIRPSAMQG